MPYNLARNSRVFFTTNVSTASGQIVAAGGSSTGPGQILAAGFSTTNTFEIQVLDGFKFSQNVNAQNVQIKEAGSSPVRGQRSFNTALNPVDITLSTYIRPRQSGTATAEERVLWNALFGAVGIAGTVQNGSTVAGSTLSGATTVITRASTSTNVASLAAATLSSSLVKGDIVTIRGITGAGSTEWNGPVKILADYTAGQALSFEYLVAPAVTATTASPTFTAANIQFHKSAWVENVLHGSNATTACSLLTSAPSNKDQLQTFGMIFYVDGQWYGIDNCAMDQAQLDFGLDAICTVAWTAKGTKLNVLTTPTGTDLTLANPILGTSGTFIGTALGKVTTANYITNKLSTTTLKLNIGGGDGGITTTSYAVPITGGNIQIQNNITYVTPANIGTLNIPIGYFTGNRAISGNLTAYLKAGAGTGNENTGDLLSKAMSVSQTSTETKFTLQVEIGGSTSGTRVEVEIPGAMLQIPTVDIADVVSTSIAFSAQSIDPILANNSYDIERTNDMYMRYYSV